MRGTLEVYTLRSQALVGNVLQDPVERKTPVYLPPGYAKSGKRYPTAYFLHGFTGTGRSWLGTPGFTLTVPERLDELVVSGKVPPFIAVFPDGWTRLGGAQWLNSAAIGNYRDYLVKDVVPWADAKLRTLPDPLARLAIGHSSGGYAALVLGAFHGEVFAHLAAHSADSYFEYGYLPDFPKAADGLTKFPSVAEWFEDFRRRVRDTRASNSDFAVLNTVAMSAAYSPRLGLPLNLELPFDPKTARLREEVWARWLSNDPVRFIPRYPEAFRKLRSIFVDCGTRDEFNLRWGARLVAEELRRVGADPVHEEFEGGHGGVSYRYDRSLQYVLPRMKHG